MTEHTPTPWRVEQDTDLIWGACDPDDNSTRGMGYSIVQGKSCSWGDRKPDMNEREANAAFIVKAVNNHDALVEALQDLLFWNEGILAGRGNHHPQDHINKIKGALAAVSTQTERGA